MAEKDTRSVEQIRRDAERARANLTDTVHQLRESVSDTADDVKRRLSPDTIRNDLIDTARRNPLQTAAAGALLAWPAMRLVRSIPLPVLMIGAGLFLTGSKSGQNLTRKAVDRASDLADGMRERAHGLTDAAKDGADHLADQAGQIAGDLREKAQDVAGRVRDVAGRVQDVVDRTATAASQASAHATAYVADFASSHSPAAPDPADVATAAREGLDTARRAIRSARAGAASSAEDVLDWVKANPVLVAGAAMVAGGFVASALPPTGVERSVAGTVSGAMRSAARQGVNAAVGTATLAAVEMARRAAKEGFDPDRMKRAARDYGESTAKAADAATAAMGEAPGGARGQS